MRKSIWYFHHYSTPPTMSGLTRPYDFGKQLIEKGYDVKVFSSAYLHYSEENLIKDKSEFIVNRDSIVPFIFIRTPPYNGSGLSRVCNMFLFYFRLVKIAYNSSFKNEKPDIIIASSPHPLTLVAGIKVAKKLGIPCICEVRDLWPESFVAYGIMGKNNPIIKLLYAGEKWIYKKADKLIFTMEGGKDYIIEKGWNKASGGPIDLNKVYHINNGVDLDAFNYNKEHYQIEDPDLENEDTFKVIYTGSIRMVNKVALLLDAAKILQEKGVEDIKFLIWGDGNERKQLEARVKEENLTNVSFKGRVDKNYIPYITSRSQLNIALGETLPLYSFGGSLNKMFDYFAAGKPVLFTFKLGYSIIDRYGAGLELSESSPMKIVESIVYFKNLSEEQYSGYCENAKRAAKEYNFEKLTERLIDVIRA